MGSGATREECRQEVTALLDYDDYKSSLLVVLDELKTRGESEKVTRAARQLIERAEAGKIDGAHIWNEDTQCGCVLGTLEVAMWDQPHNLSFETAARKDYIRHPYYYSPIEIALMVAFLDEFPESDDEPNYWEQYRAEPLSWEEALDLVRATTTEWLEKEGVS